MFTLVRHAHAGDKKEWALPDQLRPLSVHGWQQAEGLIETLTGRPGPVLPASAHPASMLPEPGPPPRLISSPYLRCQQTLLPLAARLGAPVEDCELLAPHADATDLDALLGDPELEGAVLCTHGETLTALIERWHGQATVRLPFAPGSLLPSGLTEKAGVWIVDGRAGRHDGVLSRSARYLPPPISAHPVPLDSAPTRRSFAVT